ncbi:HNH endonuclease signature motif containing protein [Pseudogemmatithrix spongiicola]|uniref:HNH endonuclease signature motif containing protein n=1 Tax=Pseudogemmatithrix spongiicola TaxID=3062599 RepID=A0AA49Q8F4_9BACT|nr:HNH endonuclease signature motif containing protein [Gemmatimonadaceae bacterium 'strain 138']WKW15731.1 HNH endonuclease signature motif containing protein [Gemmatimonadaceae bacterium 'strain 318']
MPIAVFRWLSRALGPDVFRAEGSGNAAKHGAVIAFRANFDHVVPLALGGPNDEQNLVACCWSCNYGKRAFTLTELGLDDPRDRPPLADAWDGLVGCIDGLRATAQARRGARASTGAT